MTLKANSRFAATQHSPPGRSIRAKKRVRSVHQAREIRQGPAEHDPLRGTEAHNRNAERRSGECAAPDHLSFTVRGGADGKSGINGLLRGASKDSKDPVRVSPEIKTMDMNTAATMQNSAVMASLTAILAAGMGIAAPSVAGGTAGLPGVSVPSISAPASMAGTSGVSVPVLSGHSEVSLPSIVTGGSASASTPSVGDMMSLPMGTHASGGMNPLATILGSNSKGGT
jgi:hypothetical protein